MANRPSTSKPLDNDKLSAKDQARLRKIGKFALHQIAENLLLGNHISTEGKTSEEIAYELMKKIQAYISAGRFEFEISIDHTDRLLKEARKALQDDRLSISSLFYATYFEHKINHLVVKASRRQKLPNVTIKQLLREVNLRGKCTWLFKLLALKEVAKQHQDTINEISEARNAFVHYKWPVEDDDPMQSDRKDREFRQRLNKAEKVVQYLRRFEETQIYNGQRSQVRKAIERPLNKSKGKSS